MWQQNIGKTVAFNSTKIKKKKKGPGKPVALDREVLNQNVDNVNRLQSAAFKKVQQGSDELRKIGQFVGKIERDCREPRNSRSCKVDK